MSYNLRNRLITGLAVAIVSLTVTASSHAALQSIDQLPYTKPLFCHDKDKRPAQKAICEFGKKVGWDNKNKEVALNIELNRNYMWVTGLYYQSAPRYLRWVGGKMAGILVDEMRVVR